MARYIRIVVQLPVEIKRQLDALRKEGYSASGFIRAAVERELATRSTRDAAQRAHSSNDKLLMVKP